jgi:metallo-beta-lactamase family protein
MKLTFHGAAGEVTGSMHLLEAAGKRILLDCGLFQGQREQARKKNTEFPADAATVDAVILSHAHIDHAGRLPLLVRQGYRGPIYCTSATKDLSAVMLADAGHIQESDAQFLRKRGLPAAEPLYTVADAAKVIEQMTAVAYDTPTDVLPGIRVTWKDAGHIVGSAAVALDITDGGATRRVVFSGDIGRAGLPIIRDPQPFPGPPADALIVESTYAGRVHETVEQSQGMLVAHVNTIARRGGKMFIPAFALGRTQEILYELHGLRLAKKIPDIPIYVDSPLAVKATDIFRAHPECFDTSEQLIDAVEKVFDFPSLRYVRSVEESKALNTVRGPAIIIAASGMAESGRILHHLANGLPEHRNMCLLVGFTASGTLGERLRQGVNPVRILGQEVPVRADVQVVAGYSAHGDKNDLAAWVQALGPRPKKAFVVHGEAGLTAMAGILKDLGVGDVTIPTLHQSVTL